MCAWYQVSGSARLRRRPEVDAILDELRDLKGDEFVVITSDTAAAHLAGGLGVNVWLAVSAAPEWRWMHERADNPWYPTMRLFRQPQLGDWSSVFDQMKDELAKLVEPSESDRGRIAFLTLIQIGREDDKQASANLRALLAKVDAKEPVRMPWPEVVAAVSALDRQALVEPVAALLERLSGRPVGPVLDAQIRHNLGRARDAADYRAKPVSCRADGTRCQRVYWLRELLRDDPNRATTERGSNRRLLQSGGQSNAEARINGNSCRGRPFFEEPSAGREGARG